MKKKRERRKIRGQEREQKINGDMKKEINKEGKRGERD